MDNTQEYITWAKAIKVYWNFQGLKLENGASIDEIYKLERAIGFTFPAPFLALYQEANGFQGNEWTKDMFNLWSLDSIATEYRDGTDKDFIGFSDFLIMSHCIGFRKTAPGIFKSDDLETPIASTFKEAIELINENSNLIY